MTIIILLLAAIFSPVLVGYTVTSFINKNSDLYPLETLALSYGTGVGLISFAMFILGVFFIPLTALNIVLACALLLGYPAYICLREKKFIDLKFARFKPFAWYESLLLGLISLKIFLAYFQALIKPVEDIDSIVYRMMEAKIFFIEQGLSLSQTRGYFIGPSTHINYPLNISLFSSWIYSALGDWNDLLVQIIFPTFLLALAVIFYYSLRRVANRAASLFCAYLLLSLPFLFYHASTSYIDAVVGFYYCSSFLFLLLFIRNKRTGYLLTSALLAGICVWTKNDGLPLAIGNLIVLLYYLVYANKGKLAVKLKQFLLYCSGVILFLAPWSIFKYVYRAQIPVPEEIPNLMKIPEYFSRVPIMLDFYYRKTLFYGHWNIAWFVLLVVIVIALARRRLRPEQGIVLFAIFFGLASFGAVYCFSANAWPYLLDGTIQNRNFLTFAPLVVYFICLSVFRKKENIIDPDK